MERSRVTYNIIVKFNVDGVVSGSMRPKASIFPVVGLAVFLADDFIVWVVHDKPMQPIDVFFLFSVDHEPHFINISTVGCEILLEVTVQNVDISLSAEEHHGNNLETAWLLPTALRRSTMELDVARAVVGIEIVVSMGVDRPSRAEFGHRLS